jgi:hypothetical protein
MLHMLDTDSASYLIKGKSPATEAKTDGTCAVDGLHLSDDPS